MEEGEKPVAFDGKLRPERDRASYQQQDLPYFPAPSNIKLAPYPSPSIPFAIQALSPTSTHNLTPPLLSHGLSLSHQLPRHETLPSACLQLVSFLCDFPGQPSSACVFV